MANTQEQAESKTMKYGKLEMPSGIVYDAETANQSFARFEAEPLERGYGHTIGNALRRILLTSIESPAVIGIRIEGVTHEYMAVEGVVEDMTDIVLNVKGALLRRLPLSETDRAREQKLLTTMLNITQEDLDNAGGQVSVTLGDLVTEATYEVINPELHLFHVTKPLKRQVDLRVMTGRGYVPSERIEISDKLMDEVAVDAAFSPVRRVVYWVENTRVGRDTEFDKLILEVHTDGRINPQEALSVATQIAVLHFLPFQSLEPIELDMDEAVDMTQDSYDDLMDKLCLRIDEIELSVRSTNCLSSANIGTIGELVLIPERRMLEFRNFGKKSLDEIKKTLTKMGLSLGMDLNHMGITEENIGEKIESYIEENKARSVSINDIMDNSTLGTTDET